MLAGTSRHQPPFEASYSDRKLRSRTSRSLAKRYGMNEKIGMKWRKRQSIEDLPMGLKERRSIVLSPMEEAAILALRAQARLPLDGVYIALKKVIPHLTRSSLHRCLQRHGVSRLPKRTVKAEEVQELRVGMFPHRYCRTAPRGRQGFPLCRCGPPINAGLRPHLSQGCQDGGRWLPQVSDPNNALQNSYRADRQRRAARPV